MATSGESGLRHKAAALATSCGMKRQEQAAVDVATSAAALPLMARHVRQSDNVDYLRLRQLRLQKLQHLLQLQLHE